MPKISKEEKTLEKHKEELRGKHVVVVGEEIYSAATQRGAETMLKKVRQKYPQKTLLYTYIPAEDLLILCL